MTGQQVSKNNTRYHSRHSTNRKNSADIKYRMDTECRFEQVYLLMNPAVVDTATTLEIYTYNYAMKYFGIHTARQ